ncbi:MAG: UDP-N-acetylglucosamine 1-carboxyvinyltransferase [Oscillospiraceae bacterium]|nr:UDP-N-acetylglucosamine 1-carboxyvinyltransferase [Oscillospiraceae bacterium]
MQKYIVRGGRPLHGEVRISGAKNAAVAIIPAALLVDGVCRIENVPQISDVTALLKILERLGARVRFLNRSDVEIDSRRIRTTRVPQELAHKLRASYYLIGALLGRFGSAEVSMPGGCNFGGVRPIDQHVKGFAAMGADVREGDFIVARAKDGRMKGANVYLDVISVGATMNIMMAAALADGVTVIENAAKEPHIVDLANFLNLMGANIKGAGTDTIRVYGVDALHGGSYAIIPDQIEAGTYMAAVAAAGGDVLVRGIIPKHMDCITAKLQEMGVEVEEEDDTLRIRREGELQRANVKTLPYPGFPTDMQPQITAVLALARGTSIVTEGVWDNRYRYVGELTRMGAQIHVDGRTAVVEGVERLTGATVQAFDLRAGAAMVVAALAAEGVSEILNIQYIERGYEDVIGKLRALGADIESAEYSEAPEEQPRQIG